MLESIQRFFTKRLRELKNVSYEGRCKTLGILSLEKRRGHLDLCLVYSFLTGINGIDHRRFFSLNSESSRCSTRVGLVTKIVRKSWEKGRFESRVTTHWNSLPQDAIFAKSLNEFKTKLFEKVKTF